MNSPFYIRLLGAASLLGTTGIIVGAFGAHFLKSKLDSASMDVLHTGVLYLYIHVLVLLFIIILAKDDEKSRWLRGAGLLTLIGIILFSGSLFIIATQTLTGINSPIIGILTPMGGLLFITGWISILLYAFSKM